MNNRKSRSLLAASALAALLLAAGHAKAGPPMICHPLDAGAATLLPWGQGSGWHSTDRSYDSSTLTRDVLRLLAPDAPLLGRMENLRRAAIYASERPAAARELLAALLARAATGPADRLAWFDAAYLIEAYRQARLGSEMDQPQLATLGKLLATMERPASAYPELNELDGYRMLARLEQLHGPSAEVQFAKAMMARDSGTARMEWQRAAAMAADGTALSRNVKTFGH